jgi:hypothetical protein
VLPIINDLKYISVSIPGKDLEPDRQTGPARSNFSDRPVFTGFLPVFFQFLIRLKRSNTGRLRTVFYCKPGRCFMTVCNENTACIRPYTAQIRYCIRCRITVIRITTKCGPFSCRISL